MPDRLLTVGNVLRIAQLLSRDGALSLTEISGRLGLNKTVTHRALATLRDEGWVVQDPLTKHYGLGLRMWEVGMGALHHLPVYTVGLPYLEDLAARQKERAGLLVYDGGEMLFLARVGLVDGAPVSGSTGARALPHTTSGGKVALAFMPEAADFLLQERTLPAITPLTLTNPMELRRELDEIRHRGYALNRGGRDASSCGVAAPVFDRTGRYIASIYVTCTTPQFTDEWIARLAPAVVACAAQISAALGYRPSWRETVASMP